MMRELYNDIQERTFNNKQNIRKKAWVQNYNKELDTIILLYENDNHFKLIGTFQGHRMITLFNNENMPNELLKLINKIR